MKCSKSFFSNRDCEHFPCHKIDDPESFNCLFCYCPLYMLGESCGGDFVIRESGVKDCTGCVIPHSPDAASYIKDRFPEIKEVCRGNCK